MEPSLFSLPQLFDDFSEAVLFFGTGQQDATPSYANPKAASLLQDKGFLSVLPRLLAQDVSDLRLALGCGETIATISALPTGQLLILQTLAPLPGPSFLESPPARMRDNLSHLFAAWESLVQRLRQADILAGYEDLLSLCSKNMHQLLRLVQQLEFLHQDVLSDVPQEPLDFSTLCRELSYDLAGRIEALPLTFTWDIEPGLLLAGRRLLLEHLILSLLSNGIKAAGPSGQVRLTLKKTEIRSESRAELTVRDNGPGIPKDRLHRLFCPQSHDGLPRPEDGSGLDLYLAHRISTLHKGVLMAGNSPERGTQVTLSLPLDPPQSLILRSPDRRLPDENLSRLLTGLSDVLPASLFLPHHED